LAAAPLLLVLLVAGGYIQYQVEKSYNTSIPGNTETLVRLDVYALGKSMLRDLLRRKKGVASRVKGVSLPANLFVYTLSGKPGCWFTKVSIRKPAAFGESLRSMGFRQQSSAADTSLFSNEAHTCMVLWCRSGAAIAFSPSGADASGELWSLLRNHHMVEVNKSPFKEIRNLNGHIVFMAPEGNGSLYFGRGSVDMVARLKIQGWTLPPAAQYAVNAKEDLLHFWCYADWKPILSGRSFRLGEIQLNGDSLGTGLRGVEARIGAPITQKDTVITYDYNDNFEKVAQVTVKETAVPLLFFRVAAPLSLSRYLERRNVISENRIDRKAFPLYQLFVTDSTRDLTISTSPAVAPASLVDTTALIGLTADFRRLAALPDLAVFRRYAGVLDRLTLRGYKSDTATLTIEGRLLCVDKSRSSFLALSQLLN